MHCTAVGKAMLAYLAEPELDEMIRNRVFEAQTRRTITSHALLRKELEKVRVRGWAVDDQEFEENLRCVGAPVWDYTGNVVAALSIAGPAFRVTPRKVTELARTVVEIAASLSIDLGAQTSVKRIR
jgi:DNA-binding IclR family transcriptional regulator